MTNYNCLCLFLRNKLVYKYEEFYHFLSISNIKIDKSMQPKFENVQKGRLPLDHFIYFLFQKYIF